MSEELQVWIDQDLCTGDGLCAQYAPDVFELDIDGAVLVGGQEDAVAAGRLGEPVNLFFESDDLGAGFLEGRHEPVVVLGHSGQLRLRCREPFLELTDVSGALGQLPPNQSEFLLQERNLAGEIVGLFLPTCGA